MLSLALAMLGATGPAAAGFPYAIHEKTLDNGLHVVVVPMKSDGVVAWYTWMRVGSRDEVDEGRTGFAHFFEHLMFYGTETLGGDARDAEILRLGAEENAWTWYDETVYHAVLDTSSLARYATIEADRFQNLKLTPDEVKRESGAVYGEFRKGQADPFTKLTEALATTAWTTHTYRHDALGFERDIQQMPTAHGYAMEFFDRYYRPDLATILVVGDAQPEPTFALIEEHFAGWERKDVDRPEVPPEPPIEEGAGARRVSVEWDGPTAARLAMAWRIDGHDPDSEDLAALEVLGHLLTAPVGRLQTRLIREEALAYSVWGGRQDFVDPCFFRIAMELKDPAHLERAEAIVREELAAFAKEVDADFLKRTRSYARYRELTRLDDPDEVASTLGWALRHGGAVDAIDRFEAKVLAVDAKGIQRAIQTWLVDDRLTVAQLVPREEPAAPDPEVEDAPPAPGAE